MSWRVYLSASERAVVAALDEEFERFGGLLAWAAWSTQAYEPIARFGLEVA